MQPTDLEDLLKEKRVIVPEDAALYLIILQEATKLRDDMPGATISAISTNTTEWFGESVAVLPPPGQLRQKIVVITRDTGLGLNEIKIVYFDHFEVVKF